MGRAIGPLSKISPADYKKNRLDTSPLETA